MIRKIWPVMLTFSMALFPATFYYFSPVIAYKGAWQGLVSGSVIVFLVLFLLSVFLGRSFCSRLCPMGGFQDLLARNSTRRFSVRYAAWIKYLIWGGWLAGLLLLFHRAGGVQGISFALETKKGFSTASLPAMIAYTCVIAAFLGISLLTGPRGSCHTICWMAPFMVIGRRVGLVAGIPSLRLNADPDKCISCGKCTRSCPMSLDVEKLAASGSITDNSCILCGKCVSACPSKVIRFSWKKVG